MLTAGSADTAGEMLQDLRRDLLQWLPLPTGFLAVYALVFVNHAFGVQGWPVFVLAGLVTSCSVLAHQLRRSRPQAAQIIYVSSLAATTLGMVALQYEIGLQLFPVLILLTISILGVRAMIGVAGLGMVVVLATSIQSSRLDYTVVGPLTVICVTTVVAWLAHRNLVTAVEWAWNSYCQARAATEEARERRAELVKTLKALDEAYGRLERFSAQLAHAREAAEEARRAKQQFVATVSHELRTPLNVIIGFAELMALSPESYGARGVPRQFLGDVNRIYRSAQHLKSLIDDVLDLSQIDARHMVLLTEEASIGEVITEAADMVWGLATKKGLQLNLDLPGDLPPISMDRLRIRQVLLNLLSNAVRFTDAGTVSVTARRTAREIQVTVADTGPGIAPEDLEHVFEEFRQLDSALNRRHQGTGLGLALSRRFVELHGGRMWAESELGRGSRFHFALPLGRVPETPPEVRPLPIPPGVQAQARRVVLVVGDQPVVTHLLRRHLQGYAIQAVPEQTLPAALQYLLPHAVIVNSTASPLAGDRPQVGAAPPISPRVPVIACPLPDPLVLGHRLGVDQYITKPITRDQLLELLQAYGGAVRRVLIVDDDAQMAELMARIVRGAPGGYEVEVACGGEEGWARIREWHPDLVLLDLVMDGLDGFGVLRLLRSDERLCTTRVIAVTAHDLLPEEAHIPGDSRIVISLPGGITVTQLLRSLQAGLDALPPPASDPAMPGGRAATLPGPPAS